MDKIIEKEVAFNQQILNEWHESIVNYKVLSSKEAKKLKRLYINETDESKKIEIRNVIVLGTLEYIYQFLKQSIFINLICNCFSMEDVISATVEAWIKYVSKEDVNTCSYLYAIDSTYTLYSKAFMNCILSNLCSNNIISFVNKKIVDELRNLTNWYYLYLVNKQKKSNFSFEDFKKIICSNSNKLNENSLLKLYNIFIYLDNVLVIKEEKVTLETINSLKYFLYFCCNMGTFNNYFIYDEQTMIDHLLSRDLIIKILTDYDWLTAKEQEIFYKMYFERKSQTSIAKENNVSPQSVNELKKRMLEKIKTKYQYYR